MTSFTAVIRFSNGLVTKVQVQAINGPLARQLLEAQYAGSGATIQNVYATR